MRKIFYVLILLVFEGCWHLSAGQDNGSVIKGVITDINGSQLAGAGVSIENQSIAVQADKDGAYIIHGLRDGKYTLKISFIGYETRLYEVTLKGIAIQDAVLFAKSVITEDVFISATRAGERSPLAYSTIDNVLLSKQNTGSDLPYLLSQTPSLVETSESGNGIGYTSLRIRGTDGSRINVTIDGIPLNDPESQQVFWVDLPDLASSVENIQIQRGVGTSSNGAGAFGATISIQTLSPDNEPFAQITSSYGSFSTIKNVVSTGTGLIAGKFAMQVRLSDLKSSGFIERTGSDHQSAFISGIFRSEKTSLKANVILGKEHTGIGWWGVPKEMLDINRRYNPAGEYTDEAGNLQYYDNESDNYYQNHFQMIYSHKINILLSVNAALHYTRGKGCYEEYREDQSLAEYNLPSVFIGDSVITSTDLIRRKWLANDFYGAVYSLKYLNNRVEATAGGGINLYLGDHFGEIIWMRNAGNTEKEYRWYTNNSRKGEISIYGKVNYSLSKKTAIFGDLQYRHILYKMSGIDDDLKDIGQEHSFGFFNPKAGLFFSISPHQDAYISFSVANREPTRSDYKEASGDPDALPKPETLYDSEIGYKLTNTKSSLAVNFFGMIYKDQLVPTGELSSVGYSIMTNVDKSYRLGIELSSGIRPSDFIDWRMNLTMSRNKINDFVEYYTNYNTSDWSSEYLSNNLGEVDIAYSPSVIWTSDLGLQIYKGIDLHLISKYVGQQYFDNTMSRDRRIDPYFVNNIRIDLTPNIRNTKLVEFQFLVNNILNAIYESNAYGGNWYEDGAEKSWSYFFPQAGINYMVKVGVKF